MDRSAVIIDRDIVDVQVGRRLRLRIRLAALRAS
jgi:hypothetical protein